MQNHSAYQMAWTNLPREVWLTGALEGRFNTVNQYLSLVYQSDQAFEYLLGYFSQVEEPTLILLFGDHQPQVATNFYTDVLGTAPDTALAQKNRWCPSSSGPTTTYRRPRGWSCPSTTCPPC